MRMKNVVLVVVLALLSLSTLALGESAAAPQLEPAAAVQLPASLTTPEPSFLSGCSANLTCGDGNVASCTGTNSCSTTLNAAICDGVTHRCPNYCLVRSSCFCGGYVQCQSNVGACSSGTETVTCNGNTVNCPNFCL